MGKGLGYLGWPAAGRWSQACSNFTASSAVDRQLRVASLEMTTFYHFKDLLWAEGVVPSEGNLWLAE